MLAQTDANVMGNVNVDGGAGYTYSQLPHPAGNINLKGDLLFTGSNAWILHTPNDGRTSLYLTPGSPPN